jgi:hypothetical protein
MDKWEYTKLDLNQVSKGMASIDVLNEAGIQGWELVSITVNNQAILKRWLPNTAVQEPARASERSSSRRAS